MNADARRLIGVDVDSNASGSSVGNMKSRAIRRGPLAELKNAMLNPRSTAFICGSLLIFTGYLAGCESDAPTTQPMSIRDRQDAALKDPFGYSVDVGKEGNNSSNSGIFDFDKDGFKKDANDVLNP